MRFLILLLLSFNAFALSLSDQQGYIAKFCGSYASPVQTATGWNIYSNATLYGKDPCPGTGCSGLAQSASMVLVTPKTLDR